MVHRSEDNADRKLIARLREQASQLGTQLGALRIADEAAGRVRRGARRPLAAAASSLSRRARLASRPSFSHAAHHVLLLT